MYLFQLSIQVKLHIYNHIKSEKATLESNKHVFKIMLYKSDLKRKQIYFKIYLSLSQKHSLKEISAIFCTY